MESMQAEAWEACANRIVTSIEKTITVIKKVDAFAPTNRKRPPLEQIALATILEEQGIVESVQEAVRFLEGKVQTVILVSNINELSDERLKVVNSVLLPLLEALLKCYQALDQIPQPAPPPLGIKNKKDKKPPPPRGMLSIQNYTDIAALLEFTVCASILPCLDTNVLTSVRNRAQYLIPKSLSGRLSRVSLLWGSAIMEEKGASLRDAVREKELRHTVEVLGSLVLLDRFRPMLLPRHLSDLYAGLFQAEALRDKTNQQGNSVAEVGGVSHQLIPTGVAAGAVDSFNQARALQTLLLQGTKGPLWLRKRVSKLLTNLASRDMPAIVQVFVTSASSSQDDMTSAAMRLVKALVAVQNERESLFPELCQQLGKLLDMNVERMNTSDFAGALTVWALLEQLPKSRLRQYFLPVLAEHVFPGDAPSEYPHQMVRRIIALASVVPAAHNTTSFCELLLASLPTRGGLNLLGQLVRIASIYTLEGGVAIKSDAIIALRMVCSIMGRAKFSSKCTTAIRGSELVSVALLHAIAPNQWDMKGRRYKISLDGNTKVGNKVTIINEELRQIDESSIVEDIGERGALVVTEVVAFLGENQEAGKTAKNKSYLPQSFFRHLLLTMFSISQNKGATSLFPNLQLIVMVVLPILCERCSPETLLLGPLLDGSGIIATFKLLFECAAASLDETFANSYEDKSSDIVVGFDNAKNKFLDILFTHEGDKCEQPNSTEDFEVENTLMSVASISLSLLTAMLELGSAQRNKQEVALLRATIPSLIVLSSLVNKRKTREHEVEKSHAEMAEMASHAAVMIASMDATPASKLSSGKREDTSFSMLIKEARKELKSEHPAIRARCVVQLRHFVRGYLVERGEKLPSKVMIVELSEPSVAASEHEILDEVLEIAMMTLADSESYVYLAGIQTIVAIADVHPKHFIAKIALGVSTGKVSLDAQPKGVLALTVDERIKLSEALLFIVRRRGEAINQYVSKIVRMMIYGFQNDRDLNQSVRAKFIQEETHAYFSKDSNDLNELTVQADCLDEKEVRVNTGGPIFEVELDEVLRSSCIAVVAEIVSVARPSSVAPFTIDLVHLVSNAMNLNVPRLVRRAVALLGASLYDASLREVENTSDTAELTTALITAKEESMKYALEASIDPVSTSANLFDPATSARSEEAMAIRRQLEDSGALVAAALYIEVQKREDENPFVSIVKRRLGEGQDETKPSLLISMT